MNERAALAAFAFKSKRPSSRRIPASPTNFLELSNVFRHLRSTGLLLSLCRPARRLRLRELQLRNLQLLALPVHRLQVRYLHLRQYGFGQLRLHAVRVKTVADAR